VNDFADRLQSALAQRAEDGLTRRRESLCSAQGPLVKINGNEYLNFCSNDYLGLANHPRVVQRLRAAASEYGVGSGASHLVCGHSKIHEELEQALAEFTGRERAVLFSSGYSANLAVLTTLLQKGDNVFEDKLNHASLLDGGLYSGARFSRFPHNDVDALAAKLDKAAGPSLVVVDGVFSMDGDEAPLSQLADICRRHQAWMMVDDAHGFGVSGTCGAGSLEKAGLDADDVPILMGTLGKALGTSGAFVAGSGVLIEALVQNARNYIYTTAAPPAIAAATLESLNLLEEESWRREHLQDLIQYFRKGANDLGLALMESESAIQPMLIGEADQAVALSQALRERGILIGAIRPPTVPRGTSRLRITLSAAHSFEQVDHVLQELAACSALESGDGGGVGSGVNSGMR
jgi:8-amino-7-oxononanoate synthase